MTNARRKRRSACPPSKRGPRGSTPRSGSILYITVCKNTVLRNLKRGENKPPLRICWGKHGKPQYAHKVDFGFTGGGGAGRVVYDPEHPMPWGARAWIEIPAPAGTILKRSIE